MPSILKINNNLLVSKGIVYFCIEILRINERERV